MIFVGTKALINKWNVHEANHEAINFGDKNTYFYLGFESREVG